MSKSSVRRRNRNRFISVIVTMLLIIVTNIAISYASGNTANQRGQLSTTVGDLAPRPNQRGQLSTTVGDLAPRPKVSVRARSSVHAPGLFLDSHCPQKGFGSIDIAGRSLSFFHPDHFHFYGFFTMFL